MTILDKIKEKRIIQLKNEKLLLEQPSLIEALNKDGLQIIGEIKRASPSKGDIANNDFDINKQEHWKTVAKLLNAYVGDNDNAADRFVGDSGFFIKPFPATYAFV